VNCELFPWPWFEETISQLEVPDEYRFLFDMKESSSVLAFAASVLVPSGEVTAEMFLKQLEASVSKRVLFLTRSFKEEKEEASRIAVPFSGGIDSLIIAALADKFVPEDECVDLINVAFGENPTYVLQLQIDKQESMDCWS
jgi:asparagine synthetase B (glutamine-hydrolysing)